MAFLSDYHPYFMTKDNAFLLWCSLDVVNEFSYFHHITSKIHKTPRKPHPIPTNTAGSITHWLDDGSTKHSHSSSINSHRTSKAPRIYLNCSKPSTLTPSTCLFFMQCHLNVYQHQHPPHARNPASLPIYPTSLRRMPGQCHHHCPRHPHATKIFKLGNTFWKKN